MRKFNVVFFKQRTVGVKMMHKWLLAVVLLMLVGGSIGLVGFPQADEPLVIALDGPLLSMDPMSKAMIRIIGTLRNVYDGFFARDGGGSLQPGLVEEWERLDEVTWRFHVKQGVKFHNGNLLTAHDLKYTLERTSISVRSQYIEIGTSIKAIDVLGDYTLDIVTNDPNPIFPSTIYSLGVMDKEWCEMYDDAYIATHAMGTGPYKFVEWVPEDHFTLEANEDYWGGSPSIKSVVFRPIVDNSTRLAALLSGEVDFINTVPLESVESVAGDNGLTLVEGAAELVFFLGMNHDPGFPTGNLKVRQAIYMALDIDEIIDAIYGGYALTPTQMVASEAYPGYDPELERIFPVNLELAKQLLAKAGYPNGFSITLDVSNDTNPNDDECALAIASQLSRIGIQVEVNAMPGSIVFPLINRGESDFFLRAWREQAFDLAENFAAHIATWAFANGGRYTNIAVDTLLIEAASVVSLDDRTTLLKGANALAMHDIATIPLLISRDFYAVKADLLNFTPRADQFLLLEEMSYK